MAVVLAFQLEDTSPLVAYSPFPDSLSAPNLSAGWNAHFSDSGFSSANIGAPASGQSSHITALDGASFQLQWTGTGIQLFGNATRASYDVSLDGQLQNASASANLAHDKLYDVQTLPNTPHTLSFTVRTDSDEAIVQFSRAVVSAPPQPPNLSANFTETPINESAWSYSGRWSFLNESDSSQISTSRGDTASLQFQGTAFVLRGGTSPDGGNYTVTLDNITTTYSSRSSFTLSDALLFYASGLDANVVHHLEVNNSDGSTLVLPLNGARVFALPSSITSGASASSPSDPQTTSQTHGLSAGTIAALALAGILIFLIVICILVYFLFYRPRKRRQALFRQPEVRFEAARTQSVLVVDVEPEPVGAKAFYDPADFAGPSRDRKSKQSDFTRWKNEIEGTWRGALGIAFRHSDSSGRRGTSASSNEYDLGAASDGYKSTSSSSNAGYTNRRNGKGKARESGTRWPLSHRREKSLSPQFKLDLPIEPLPGSSLAPSHQRHDPSSISSLSYMSSPSLRPGTIPSEPPSPHRPSPFPNTHSRANSSNMLLSTMHNIPPQPPEPRQPTPPAPIAAPPPQDPPRVDDRGSVRDYDAVDDDQSILGDGTARIALRSLSPRTSENEQSPKQRSGKRRAKDKERRRDKERQKTPSPLGKPATIPPATSGDDAAAALFLRSTSPFQVDFDVSNARGARLSGQSKVRFEGDSGGEGSSDKDKSQPKNKGKQSASKPKAALASSSSHLQDISFLDFTSSSEASVLTRSASNNFSTSSRSFGGDPKSHWSMGGSSATASLPQSAQGQSGQQPKSRWSATTAPSSEAFVASSDSNSASFPFPTDLPASPHHPEGTFIPPQPPPPFLTTVVGQQLQEGSGSTLNSLNAHPSDLNSLSLTSPTDSVPMSVSDVHFRPRDSDTPDMGPRQTAVLPSHPPLPTPTPTTSRFPTNSSPTPPGA
ncbi:hypothetical protein MKEN_00703300 [Mycena kentingensis (nom. inval.)]|nr:hypothetical protein MKEN_00703300 [Mycena kentingensis (nom. inval.)]